METSLTRRRRPLWMTSFGQEPMGDVWFDRPSDTWPRWEGQEFVPDINIYDKDDKYYMVAELPGIKRDDISIDIDNNVVTLTGKKKAEKEGEGADYYWKEASYGSFSRSFRLPSKVEEDKVEAKFVDGVLTLELPHKESPKRRKIEIKS